jgi:hypothetical protein
MSRSTRSTKPLSAARARGIDGEGLFFETGSRRTTLRVNSFANFEEMLAYGTRRPKGVPVLAYETFVEDGEMLAEGSPACGVREVSLGNRLHGRVDICMGGCKHYGEYAFRLREICP